MNTIKSITRRKEGKEMYREIKFRGYSKYHNKWLYGSLVDNLFRRRSTKEKISYIFDTSLNEDYDCWEDFIQDEEIEVVTKSVGQYTGLKDKNGVEIYEGDIVKGYFQHKTWKNKKINFVGKVYWDTTTLSFEVNVAHSSVLTNGFCKDIEVIGNIYENSELLKGEE